MANDNSEQPQSLGPHTISDDRAALIRAHVAMLGATALTISDQLPISADASDLLRVLEQEAE